MGNADVVHGDVTPAARRPVDDLDVVIRLPLWADRRRSGSTRFLMCFHSPIEDQAVRQVSRVVARSEKRDWVRLPRRDWISTGPGAGHGV